MMRAFHNCTNECPGVLGVCVMCTQNLTNVTIGNAGFLFVIQSNRQIFKKVDFSFETIYRFYLFVSHKAPVAA